jgi:CheY-like chemotaxis protein
LDSGAALVERRDFPLSTIMLHLIHDFAPIAAQKGLELHFVESSLMVNSDPVYLKRILQNLISNAIRYTDTGRVLFGVRRNGGSARIEVWDTGRGISEADQHIIFDEFQRLETRASASEGLGLGLAIVERACDRLGHQVHLWSVPETGSGFFVNVPISDPDVTASRPIDAVTSDPDLQKRHLIVLLVENDDTLRRAMTTLLEKWGADVLDVASGQAAFDLLAEVEIVPDAMIIDYQLDVSMDGVTFATTLLRQFPDIETRIISANRTRELRQKCRSAGLELLLKPVDPQSLLDFLFGP